MAVNNPWLTPFERSFNDIKNKLIEAIKIKVPEITNFSEANIFIRLISLFAAIAEVLHYYIDNSARESFFVSARKYSSLVKHGKMVDYNIKSANPASVDILLYLQNGATLTNDLVIAIGTEFFSDTIKFVTTKEYVWQKGTYAITITASNLSYVDDVIFGEVTNEDITITIGDLGNNYYCEGSMVLQSVIDDIITPWALVETFAYSKPSDHHFKVVLDQDQEPWVVFGNGVMGAKPTVGSSLVGRYAITDGIAGRVAPNTITSVPGDILTQNPEVICMNRSQASGGTNYEDFNMLKEHIPLHIRSLGVAITEEDYVSVTKTLPGVDKAYVKQECGKNVIVYITPDGGGIASLGLISATRDKLLKKKVLGTSILVKAASEALIYLNIEITGKNSYKASDISKQVYDGLISLYDYNNSDIGKPVRVSELYAFLEGLSMVDYLNIKNLYLKPVPISYSGAVELTFEIDIKNVTRDISYLIRYDEQLGTFSIININGIPTGVDIPYLGQNSVWKTVIVNGDEWLIKILPSVGGAYINGDIWKVTLLKNNVDQLSSDLSIPLIKTSSQVNLTIIEKI